MSSDAELHILDFEYTGVNSRGFDVCNLLNAVCEGMYITTGKFDPKTHFPKKAEIKNWVKAYCDVNLSSLSSYSTQEEDRYLRAALVSDEGLMALLEFAPIAELRWGIWAIVQAGVCDVNFDYLSYAKVRLEEGYEWYKKTMSDEVMSNCTELI